jgi:TatD DNase family protein
MCAFIRSHKDRLAAIGEVGLDYWIVKEESQREIQREIFRGFIELSKELALPLNVHSRSAGRHVVSVLLESSADRVQLHAFDGKFSAAMPAVEAGFFFSIPPTVVRSEQKLKLAKKLPLSCLLIETDSPVLGPVPQERNEPANAPVAL